MNSQFREVLWIEKQKNNIIQRIKNHFSNQTELKSQKIANLLDNIAHYLDSGINLLQVLELLKSQTKDKELEMVLQQTKREVETGSNLSNAFKSTNKFPDYIINILKAGEESNFQKVLRNTADFLNRIEEFKNNVITSLVYPFIIISVMFVVLLIMLGWVVPKFANLFTSSGISLPQSTQLLLKISQYAQYWQVYSITILLIILAVHYYYRTNNGKKVIDNLLFKIPFIGDLILQINITRIANNLSILRESGVSILKSLNIITSIIDNIVLKNIFSEAKNRVEKGEDLSTCLNDYETILPLDFIMQVEVGENTATLPDMLDKIASRYEKRVNNKLESMLSAIKPISIIIMAILGGGIVYGIMDAMFSMFTNM